MRHAKTRRYPMLLCLLLATPLYAQSGPEPARGRHGMVASSDEYASQVGVEILQRGGNAVDAAVAVGFALAVTHPAAGNLGGGGFMLIRLADGRTVAIDYREVAPAGAHRDLYLDKDGKIIEDASLLGYRAAGVPGTVAGLHLALEKYGTLKWADVLEPARKLAADGFVVSPALAESLKRADALAQFPESKRIFLRDGKHYEKDEIFRQPELAETLARLQKEGPREFYEGRTARLIAEDMKNNDGLITLDDLKAYRPAVREPLRGTYRGHEIITMPPPSSGGVALLEMLNVLEQYNLTALGHDSPEKCHLLIEAMRRAFADRAEFLGDPDFVKIPVVGLTSKSYAAQLAKGIDLRRATPSAQLRHGAPAAYESPQTTHFSVVDAAGNAVANTYTLNTGYGSCVTVRGAGFLLNNEMDDFTSKPGSPNVFGLIQGERNAIAPRKRPLSSMTPTIVLKDGKLFLVIGTPGGPTIINTVLQTLVNVVDHGMNVRQAIEAPRFHHQWLPDTVAYEASGLPDAARAALESKGHVLGPKPRILGDAQGIMVDPKTGMRYGASDPRGGFGKAVGY